jgi:phosphatidylserine decarboxylase
VNTPFSGWKEGLKYYGPVLLLALIPLATPYPWTAVPILLIALATALFFRDFPRPITAEPHQIVSPADGTIVAIEDLPQTPHYQGPTRRISIFLSVLNAHVNRAPYDAQINAIKYAPGQFKDARNPESSQVNESNALWLDTHQGPMTVRQISGAVARRIVCPATPGTTLQKGEKFGMIRFGSRTELYLPPDTHVCVNLKDKVYAGTSILAKFNEN